MVGWDKKDDAVIKELLERLDRETSGKTLKEKFLSLREKIQEIFQSPNFRTAIKVGALAAAVTAAVTATGLVINHFKKTKEKNDQNAKKWILAFFLGKLNSNYLKKEELKNNPSSLGQKIIPRERCSRESGKL